MRVLLLNAIDRRNELHGRYPNLGLHLLAEMVRDIADVTISDRMPPATDRYDLVGISALSQNWPIAKRYMAECYVRDWPAIIGGMHVTALKALPPIAWACWGEGETSLRTMVTRLANGQAVYYSDGKPISDLDDLPMPIPDRVRRFTHIFTSRGCPHHCRFCASSRFWGPLRFYSADYVVEWLERLYRKGARFVSFFDDLFYHDRARLEKIAAGLEKRQLIGRLRFSANARADTIDESLLSTLRRMGFVSLGFGLESGNDETLQWLKGPRATVKQNHRAIRMTRDAGLAANASFIIGCPQETESQIEDTFRFIQTAPLNLVETHLLTPYPGTPIWDYALERGLVSENMDWSRLRVAPPHENPVILSEAIPKEKLLSIYRRFQRYRIWHNVRNIWSTPQVSVLPRWILKQFMSWMVKGGETV